jgi:hypothetical protein
MSISDAELISLAEQSLAGNETTEEETVEEVNEEEVVDEETITSDDDEVVDDGEEVVEDEEITEEDEENEEEEEVVDDKHTVKINGEEVEVTTDELKKGYSTHQAAMAKFEQADLLHKQATSFIEMLKSDPMSVLSDPAIGLNPREIAEAYLAEQLEFDQLTDEQKEHLEAKKKLAAYEKEKKEREQREHDERLKVATEQAQEEYTTRINTNDLPPGVYSYTLSLANASKSGKIVVLK